MITDITERKQTGRTAAEIGSQPAYIFDNTDASYVLIDTELKVLSFNIVAQANVGRQGNILEEGKMLWIIFRMREKRRLKVYKKSHCRWKHSIEAPGAYPGGTVKWYEVKWIGIRNKAGIICGVYLPVTI